MKDFKDLRVWAKAHELTMLVYKLTRAFPRDEVYGLTSQVRRSAASIGANIAEGCGRQFGRRNGALSSNRAVAPPAKPSIIYCSHTTWDFYNKADFQAAEQSVVAVQRMLTALVQKVQPRGRKSKAEQSQEGP